MTNRNCDSESSSTLLKENIRFSLDTYVAFVLRGELTKRNFPPGKIENRKIHVCKRVQQVKPNVRNNSRATMQLLAGLFIPFLSEEAKEARDEQRFTPACNRIHM